MGLLPLVKGVDGRWVPGIGDPSFMGWATVAAYFATAWLCYRASRRASGFDPYSSVDQKVAWVWMGLALLLGGLGINKQLDLQSLVTQLGEDMAHAQGWYEHRRIVQAVFVAGIGVGSLAAGGLGLWWLRDKLKQLWPAVLGMALMLGFVVVRAASFHHVDWLLYRATGPVKLNWVLELGALAVVAWAAVRPTAAAAASSWKGRATSSPGA
jgi:hypothetical protein